MNLSRRLSVVFFVAALLLAIMLVMFLLLVPGNKHAGADGAEVTLEHSSLLSIAECDGYTVVDVADPWGDALLQRYILVPKERELPSSLPEGTVLRTPLERVLLFSGVHVALFEELGAGGSIKAVCDAQYVYSCETAAAIAEGKVIDCGSSLDVNLERVAEASPEAIFVLPYENGGYGKLSRVGVPLVECADYMESSPLACAEWIRFYGRLMGKGAVADSLFNAVCHDYDALCALAAKETARPKLMCELKSSSAWYVPAGGSTMGRMYSDAGADYLFSYCEGTGSVPLSFEVVLDKAADADIWLVKYNSPLEKTRAAMLAECGGYSHFGPFRQGNVFACNTARKRIFEESAFHPEKLLKELVALFHPRLFPGYEPVYYERMR